jgi:predicted nucleic acid-binding protein
LRALASEPLDLDAARRLRKLIDCLIAAVAIRADAPVLHADTDFDVLARHTRLRLAQPETRHAAGRRRG